MRKHPVRLVLIVVAVAALLVTIGPWPVASLWRGSGITGQTTVGPTCPVDQAGHFPGRVATDAYLREAG